MASIKHLIFLIISLITFGYTFLVVGKFMFFLSAPRNVAKPYVWVFNLMDNDSRIKTALPVIVYDLLYILLFIFQHSFMKSQIIRSLFQKLGSLQCLERTIYTLTSSLCLQVMFLFLFYCRVVLNKKIKCIFVKKMEEAMKYDFK